MSPQLPKSAGNFELYLMYSPAISRVVSRRPPDSNPIMASPARSEPAGSGPAGPRGRALPRCRASGSGPERPGPSSGPRRTASWPGPGAWCWSPARAGCQASSRMASRYRSVATSVITSPAISTFTPVMTGSVSSRLAAGVIWPIAVANTPPSTVPASRGSSGSRGYSPMGSVTRLNDAGPQVRVTSSASSTSIGMPGKAAGDLGQQPPGDQHRPRLGHVRVDADPGRDLVIEAGQGQPARLRRQQQPGQAPGARAGTAASALSRRPPQPAHRAPPRTASQPPPIASKPTRLHTNIRMRHRHFRVSWLTPRIWARKI